ncbi:PREDICTED: thyroid receptor-interacting protein 11-like [Nicrophorus vespilloides]|uniref:Thyroid receptor-interacting protein 11-like n=1 Tax=Nicrophorus vespilloides TaxID=110193 RepID=A0ABM1MTW8_NICVS|nr:PREDICTED: thyroid receptor-interacting protein 11-like [Nicrophorus vespilloides]XP_017778018.1 PREDICTED: thyroid receptor-interacting protein 11-like [Nicrophorus vespilloides]XP_017778019.1 PREDICTED: thyroid receptor-interacting protein 11-like [Nicrophorus vespilloides]
MSWLNDSLNNIKGQISSFASGVLAEEDPHDTGGGSDATDWKTLVAAQENEIELLKRHNAELLEKVQRNIKVTNETNEDGWGWETQEEVRVESATEDVERLRRRIEELEVEKRDLVSSLEQLDQDCQQTTDKLVTIKDELQAHNTKLCGDVDELRRKNEFLQKINDENQRKISKLEAEADKEKVAELTSKLIELEAKDSEAEGGEGSICGDGCKQIAVKLLEVEQQFEDYKSRSQIHSEDYLKLERILEKYEKKVSAYEKEIGRLNKFQEKFNAIQELVQSEAGLTLDVSNFTVTLKRILEEYASLKRDSSAFQTATKKMDEELQRLLSENRKLSDEIHLKDQDLKHYEEECNDLIKNNEMLIQRVEESGNLQSIPETNEENLLLLENQLDAANERIKELENIPSDDVKNKYERLKTNYKELENVKEGLMHNLEDMKSTYVDCFHEKENLNSTVDQIKIEFENTEYKYAEQIINMETLKEEIENLTTAIEDLSKKNKKLEELNVDFETKNELLQKEVDDLKQELTTELDNMEQKDAERLTLIEKLQGTKMAETSLKLQHDTLLKEFGNMQAANQKITGNVQELNANIEVYKEKLSKSDEENQNLKEISSNVQEIIAEKNILLEERNQLQRAVMELEENLSASGEELRLQLEASNAQKDQIQADFENFKSSVAENNKPLEDAKQCEQLQAQLVELTENRNQMILLIQEKHQENVNYHGEIQRLHQLLAAETEKCKQLERNEENEKLAEQNGFLRDKCARLAENLLQEQSNAQKITTEWSEREIGLQKKLDSLREHLLTIEDTYTKEVQVAELKCEEMQAKLRDVEERERHSSDRYTSVNIRANQQVETLQTQLQLVTNQRDDFKRKVDDYEDQVSRQSAAVVNLQSVLQQFQREKEKDIFDETERIRRQITSEKKVQDILRQEIGELRLQLEESKEGLMAAVRLSDQMEASKKQVVQMKEEVAKLQSDLTRSEDKCSKLSNQTDGKVDKMLIKNLIIGLVSSNNNLSKDQNQILKIISTVLDFNQQDIEKVNLNRNQQHSWFGSLLHPQGQAMTQESLSQAFVKFLEAESKPRILPNLLESSSESVGKEENGGAKRKSPQPLLLNEVVLPTFADFGQSRNSSSILKDVLKDNS